MFDKLHLTMAILFGSQTAEAPPESAMRQRAATLLAVVDRSIDAGDWDVNGIGPSQAIAALSIALDGGQPDVILGGRTLDLVDMCVPAIATGEWMIGAEELEAVFEASSAAGAFATANDDPNPAAVAI